MKRIVLLFFAFHSSLFTLHAQSWLWATEAVPKNANANSDLFGDHCIATDKAGNAYITGYFGDSLSIGAFNIANTKVSGDMFVAKYDSTGAAIWARQAKLINAASTSVGNGVAVDASGNVYVTGYFEDSVTIGAFTLTTGNPDREMFLVKYDPNGNVVWVKQSVKAGIKCTASATSLAIDRSGDIYVTGSFIGVTSFGAFTLFGNSVNPNVFLAKYDPSGNEVWVRQTTTPGFTGAGAAYSVAVDTAMSACITGYFYKTLIFGATHLNGTMSDNVFVAKYGAGGNLTWVTQTNTHSSGSWGIGRSIAIDGAGNYYVTGSCHDTLSFGHDTLRSASNVDNVFLTKYDGNGNVIWAEQATILDNNTWQGFSVACDTLIRGGGYLVLQGGNVHPYQIIFGNYILSYITNYQSATILMKFDSTGKITCETMLSEGDEDDGSGVAADNSGKYIYLGGDLANTSVFGRDTLKYGGDLPFVARWQTCACNAFTTACCSTTINSGDAVAITTSPASAYQWQPLAGLNCSTCQSPLASPTVTTMYTVMASYASGCSATDSVLITVNTPEKCDNIFVPDAFSPNNDGQNDILYVKGNCINTMDFIVYDRWGNKVFQTKDINNGWDGSYNKQPMNSGTYAYYLSVVLNNGNKVNKKGNITLIR